MPSTTSDRQGDVHSMTSNTPKALTAAMIENPAQDNVTDDAHTTVEELRALCRRFVAELSRAPGPDALAFFEAAPPAWGLRPDAPYPAPDADLKTGRERALAAYSALKAARDGGEAA